jgi:hypothetical protein
MLEFRSRPQLSKRTSPALGSFWQRRESLETAGSSARPDFGNGNNSDRFGYSENSKDWKIEVGMPFAKGIADAEKSL